MGLFDRHNIEQIESFASVIKIQIYLPNDIIVKQGDIGNDFYLIIDGFVEVRTETKDY